MKKILALILLAGLFLPIPNLRAQSKLWFSDVKSDHENYQAIRYLWENDIIQGYADGSFQPEKIVNRAEALKIILLSAKIPVPPAITESGFPDVDPKQWFAKYVTAARTRKIINGYPDGTFRPQDSVNLVESLKIILETNQIDLTKIVIPKDPFADVQLNQPHTPYVQYAKINNLIVPDQENLVYPDKSITRAELAELIYRIDYVIQNKKPYPAKLNISENKIAKIIQVATPATLKNAAKITDSTPEIIDLTSDQQNNIFILAKFKTPTIEYGESGIYKIDQNGIATFFISSKEIEKQTGLLPNISLISTDIHDNLYVFDEKSQSLIKISLSKESNIYLNGNKLVNTIGKIDSASGGKKIKIKNFAIKSDGLIYLYDEYLGFEQEHIPLLWLINPNTYQAETLSRLEIQLFTGPTSKYFIQYMTLSQNDELFFLEEQSGHILKLDDTQEISLVYNQINSIEPYVSIQSMALDQQELLFFNTQNRSLFMIDSSAPPENMNMTKLSPPLYLSISKMTVNPAGEIYALDKLSGSIYLISLN